MFCAGDMVLIGAGGSLQWWNIVLGEHMNISNFHIDVNYVSFQMRDRFYKKIKKNGNLDTKKNIQENKTPYPKIIKTELLTIYRGHCHTQGNWRNI